MLYLITIVVTWFRLTGQYRQTETKQKSMYIKPQNKLEFSAVNKKRYGKNQLRNERVRSS